MSPKAPGRVLLDGRGLITVRDADYVTAGGEASIYRVGDTILKIYADPAKMKRDGMVDKVKLLSRMNHVHIAAPKGAVIDGSNSPIGFYMPFQEGEPLSRFFVTDHRQRTGFRDRDAIELSYQMHEIVSHAHDHKALMVDANELNWIVQFEANKRLGATVIDVDSWAIGRWPASVIMPSIRDWNAYDFTQLTDWFAWGIVSFQVFTGIHPFKGKLDGYKPGELVRRMKDNASVFDKRVRLPHAVRDFACIPAPLLNWYRAAFQEGVRSTPPSPYLQVTTAKAARVLRAAKKSTTGTLVFEKILSRIERADEAVRIWANGAVLFSSGDIVDINTMKPLTTVQSRDVEVIRVPRGWVISDRAKIAFVDDAGARTDVSYGLALDRIFRGGETLFGITDRNLIELHVTTFAKPSLTARVPASILGNSAKWFDDVGVQNALGATFIIMPFGGNSIAQVRVRELDGLTVVAAKAGARFASFTAVDRNGDHHRIELTFTKAHNSYQAWTGPAESADLNMAILPRGVVATIVNDDELTIFVPTTGEVKKVKDGGITTSMRLAVWGEKIAYIYEGAVWTMRMT